MITWPPSLVEEIAARRAILFIGAGISASSIDSKGTSPPTWDALLESAKNELVEDSGEKDFISSLIDKGLLLDAAEVIFENVSQPERRIFFKEKFATPQYKPSDFHSVIQDIDVKILITTNYDQIYEIQCNALNAGKGYSVRSYHDKQILNDIRSKDNVIIKAHGCIDKTEDIILTRSDYFNIKRDFSYFYHVLNSLLTVNTVLFLGCGMSDPDIQLILENTNIAAYSDHPHYCIIPNGKHRALKSAMEKAYNIKILEYNHVKGDNHQELLDSLIELRDLVLSIRPKML